MAEYENFYIDDIEGRNKPIGCPNVPLESSKPAVIDVFYKGGRHGDRSKVIPARSKEQQKLIQLKKQVMRGVR